MSDSFWIDMLKSNKGFANPEKWVDYARSHKFTYVEAQNVICCPDCGEALHGKLGQYVYYSTLSNLNECVSCGLIYADVRIDPRIIQQHFERTYKDEQYFVWQREAIFRQVVSLIDALSPRSATVLDIGGAKGHLLAMLKGCRPDIGAYLNDVSGDACVWAEKHYRLKAINGFAADIIPPPEGFDAVSIIDALYYEPNISKLFLQLPKLVKPNGHLIMRLPNLALLIKVCQGLRKAWSIAMPQELCDGISFFNPEHLYIFTRQYLIKKLHGIGFRDVRFIPSALLLGDKRKPVRRLCYEIGILLGTLSAGKVVATPSFIVVATRR